MATRQSSLRQIESEKKSGEGSKGVILKKTKSDDCERIKIEINVNNRRSESMSSTEKFYPKMNEDIGEINSEFIEMAREALKVEPCRRSDFHIDSILNYITELHAFKELSYSEKYNLCAAAVLKSYSVPSTVIVKKGEKISGIYIVMLGRVRYCFEEFGHGETEEVDQEEVSYLEPGDTFGLTAESVESIDVISNATFKIDSCPCELIQIECDEYLKYGELEGKHFEMEENDDIEALYDNNILVSATADKLLETLFDQKYLEYDPTFHVDFFLTYHLSQISDDKIVEKIHSALKIYDSRIQAINILYTWILYCPEDFKTEYMRDFVYCVLNTLDDKNELPFINNILNALYCQSLAYEYHVLIHPSNDVPFRLKYRLVITPTEKSHLELYVVDVTSKIEGTSTAGGLKVGDQVILLNDLRVSDLTLNQLRKLLLTQSLFILIVKRCEIKYRYYQKNLDDVYDIMQKSATNVYGGGSVRNFTQVISTSTISKGGPSRSTLKKRTLLKTIGTRMGMKPANTISESSNAASISKNNSNTTCDDDIISLPSIESLNNKNLRYNHIHKHAQYDEIRETMDNLSVSSSSMNANHFVIKVYTSSTSEPKYFLISRMDNCKKIVNEILNAFPIRRSSMINADKHAQTNNSEFYLFISQVSEVGFKLSRLFDEIYNLPSKYQSGCRFFVTRSAAELKIPKEIEVEMKSEITDIFLPLDDHYIAIMLTFSDFYYYTRVSSKEYISVFMKNCQISDQNLQYFEMRCNNEVTWVLDEVLHEPNAKLRSRVIAKFIKIAHHCLDLGNFNSFFSIIGGLEHSMVSRLKSTWELLSPKHHKNFNLLKDLCSPANNSTAYKEWCVRYNMNQNKMKNAILIPLMPLVKKNLTFIHESNATATSNQINVWKLRLIAKELRKMYYFRDPIFSLEHAFKIKPTFNSSLLHKPTLTLSPYISNDNSIMLSDISSTILSFSVLERSTRSAESVSSISCTDKRVYDEFVMMNRVKKYLDKIDNLKYDTELFQTKSYEYDIPPKFILESRTKVTFSENDSTHPQFNSAFSSTSSVIVTSSLTPTDKSSVETPTEPTSTDNDCKILGTLV